MRTSWYWRSFRYQFFRTAEGMRRRRAFWWAYVRPRGNHYRSRDFQR